MVLKQKSQPPAIVQSTTKLVDDNFKIIVNSNGVGAEFQQLLVDVVGSNNASSEPKVSIANMQYEILGTGNVTVFFKGDNTKKVELSELTVNKIAKEIADVLGTPDIF